MQDGIWLKQYKCGRKTCDNVQAEEPPPKPNTVKLPGKLYFDIEAGYSKFLAFERKVPSKYLSMPFEEGIILGWAAAWLDENNDFQYIYSHFVKQAESLIGDDKRILQEIWGLLDSADFLIGHNSDGYDLKMLRGRFEHWGMDFPWEAKQIDTLKLSRKYTKRISHSLDYLTGGKKKEIDGDDWRKIALTGDPDALRRMEEYCRQDVRAGIDWFRDFTRKLQASGVKVYK